MGNHAEDRILQPSQFKRTMNCPGWGQFCKEHNIAPSPPSRYALEGTAAHYVAERCLTRDLPVSSMRGKAVHVDAGNGEIARFDVTDEMVEAVEVYLSEINRIRKEVVGGSFHVEQVLDLTHLVPGMFGTGDHVAIEPLGRGHVHDLKYGAGVLVEVEDNPQLMIYALGAIGPGNPHMMGEIEVHIVQPRIPHSSGPVRSVVYSVDELLQWGETVLIPKAKAAQMPGAPLVPGLWCKWCDAEVRCPELRRQTVSSMFPESTEIPTVIEPPAVETIAPERFDRVLEFAEVMEDWIKAVKKEAYQRLCNGTADAPKSMKLVAGRLSNCKWGQPIEVIYKSLAPLLPAAELYEPRQIKSVPQIEKALKATGMTAKEAKAVTINLIAERTEGRPLMVPVTDPRPAYNPVELMFNVED